jgi:hypothetical protein
MKYMKPMKRMIRFPIDPKEEYRMDPQKAAQKLKELKERRRKDFWVPKPGKNYVRFLPNWNLEPDGDFYRETGYHRKLGPARDKSAVCLIKEGFERCPVCELVRELWKTKNAEDVELAKSIKRQDRVYYNIIDLTDKPKGVQVYISGTDVLEQLLGYCANPKYGDISDPVNGRNVEIVFTEGKNTKSGWNSYDIQPDPDRTPVENEEWLQQLQDLNAAIKPLPYEKMEALLMGESVPEGEEIPEEGKTETSQEIKATTEQEKPKSTVKPPCFSKFSADDTECVACVVKGECEETKRQKRIPKEPVPSEVQTSPSEKEQVRVGKGQALHWDVTTDKDKKATNIQAMLERIRFEKQQGKK